MLIIPFMTLLVPAHSHAWGIESRIEALVSRMTLEEKLGQMSQGGLPDRVTPALRDLIRRGRLGSVFGYGSPAVRAELQRIATKESRLGIPLIIGNDVIHGWITGFPIPLAQAASWDPKLVQDCSRVAGRESAADGIQWTFSPMMDIARDPRWGRIAEGYGEDPYLAGRMAVATVRGYQGASLAAPDSIAACGKHFVGYGAAEGGRDYNSTWIPETVLRDVYLKPFQATKEAGIASFMSAFNAINGVPASANPLTLRKILRDEWKFDGFVVSDFTAVHELIEHGIASSGAEAARKAIQAGVDMEMISDDYSRNGRALVESGQLDRKLIDDSVRNILRVKFRLGLFDGRPQGLPKTRPAPTSTTLALSNKLAQEGLVLLKNERGALPFPRSIGRIAVIGALANSKEDQLGCWAAADPLTSVTPLEALRARLGSGNVVFASGEPAVVAKPDNGPGGWDRFLRKALTDKSHAGFPAAIETARKADVVLLFLGEKRDFSGEASSRSSLDLPGAQADLVAEIAKLGKPMIVVIMAGRPLTFHESARKMDAILYAWHGGPMAGPAIVDTLFGDRVPSGKLPVTFPRTVGQVPIYYDHLNTGRPPGQTGPAAVDHYRSKYLDIEFTPEYPFGFGLSYTTFHYSKTRVSRSHAPQGGHLTVSAEVTNAGGLAGDEVVQLYTHQRSASIARPVRELKGFQRVHLMPGETRTVSFELSTRDLAFTNSNMRFVTEPGRFEAWISPDSVSGQPGTFEVGR